MLIEWVLVHLHRESLLCHAEQALNPHQNKKHTHLNKSWLSVSDQLDRPEMYSCTPGSCNTVAVFLTAPALSSPHSTTPSCVLCTSSIVRHESV